ncbi:MAG: SDR family NAD(P)-dependent oxidoreductase [Flavobacteriaceae bacterium]
MKKNILIIGGTSGIGAALAQQLQEEAKLYLASRNATEAPVNAEKINFDASTEILPIKALPEHLDGFIYCPGSIQLRPFKGLKPDAFRADFELNVMGAIQCLQQVLPLLQKAPQASVVFFSTVAVQTGMPFHASVASAKGALEGLTRTLAAEWAPKIRVNAIAPSLVNTPLADKFLNNETKQARAAERHPLQRVGTPEEIAALAAFLINDNSAWMTGQIVTVDGGIGSTKT